MGRILYSRSSKLWYLEVAYVGNENKGVKHSQTLTLELWASCSQQQKHRGSFVLLTLKFLGCGNCQSAKYGPNCIPWY